MDTRLAAVIHDVGIVAADVFQCVAEDRHAIEGTLVVDGLGEGGDAMRKVADKRGHAFVDIYEMTGDPKAPLTDNGIHLTAHGYWHTAVKVFGSSQQSQSKIDVSLPEMFAFLAA